MTIRTKKEYADLSVIDAKVSIERLNKNIINLSAFRAYKSQRRLLQCLAMEYNYQDKKSKCAVPKSKMLNVSKLLEYKGYKGIYENTEKSLKIFDEYKNHNAKKCDIIYLLKNINFKWISNITNIDNIIQKINNL